MKERVGLREPGQPLAAGAASPHVAHDRRIVTPFEHDTLRALAVSKATGTLGGSLLLLQDGDQGIQRPAAVCAVAKLACDRGGGGFGPRLTACITRIQPWAVAATALN